jgi:hypothetical protein
VNQRSRIAREHDATIARTVELEAHGARLATWPLQLCARIARFRHLWREKLALTVHMS